MSSRPPLAEKALSEAFARLRYRDTSLLIWQQQQQKLESLPPATYLNRSHSMWYSQYGNQAILVRDRNKTDVARDTGQSKFCTVM
uniref:BRD3 opposite strand n=1 Tax=Anolis carolinensis TaxID=28377 RepID=A0A803T0B2_ANOCA